MLAMSLLVYSIENEEASITEVAGNTFRSHIQVLVTEPMPAPVLVGLPRRCAAQIAESSIYGF
jgi:hypothetical protein